MRLVTGPFILLAAWVGATDPALASCERFAPFGQPVHRSLADQAGMIPPPAWSVICHAGQVVAFNPEHNVSDWVAFRLRREDLLKPKVPRKRAFRPDPEVPDEEVTPEYAVKHLCIMGSAKDCIRQLEEVWEVTGGFGTLLMTSKDWDDQDKWRRSMKLLAEEVVPAMPSI